MGSVIRAYNSLLSDRLPMGSLLYLAFITLDKLNYSVDLQDKLYTTAVAVTSNAQMVDYTSEGFKITPIITRS